VRASLARRARARGMEARVAALVAHRRAAPTRGELELRLGRREGSAFAPGVSREAFLQLERDMEEEPGLVADERWVELVDYHYALRRGERARTRVEFDAQRMALSTAHVAKRGAAHVLLGTDGDAACRVAYAAEEPVEPPPACLPTHVRVKQRRCFRDVRDGRVVWSYELSKTWAASSRSVVEHLQRTTEPTYEVECELVDEGGGYMRARADAEVAASLCLKARLLLGDAELHAV
jgi:hypothetical protein